MTLDEAIKHAEEVAEELETFCSQISFASFTKKHCECAAEHRQLAEWLKDYKRMKEQEPQIFKWCTDCKEYDQEKHCCHRWSKVIRDTVEEMKQEQEPILDKIRAEIIELRSRQNVGVLECLDIIDKYRAEEVKAFLEEVEDGT